MGFRRSDLQEAFFVPGTHAFRVCGAPGSQGRPPVVAPERRGNLGRARGVLAPGYFGAASGLLRPGDLVYVRGRTADGWPAPSPRCGWRCLTVRAGARGSVAVRLVQDFGRTDDADGPSLPALAPAPAAPPRRGGGRPPGSRNKKNGALGFHADH